MGVEHDASEQEVKRAYRRRARELHPDVNPAEDARQRFAEVTMAYEVLSDHQKRKIVDLGGDPFYNGARSHARDSNAGFGGLRDIFDASFGDATASGRGSRSRVRQGTDALIRIPLTLGECAAGVTREIMVNTAVLCDQCLGTGSESGNAAGQLRQLRGPRRDRDGAAIIPR